MKKTLFPIMLLGTLTLYHAQVGIGTDVPQSTLDVVGKPTDISVKDGIIAPRLTGDQLAAKTYAAAQTGAYVYVTAAASTPTGQVINVTSAGYYYFDGPNNVWQKISKSTDVDLRLIGNNNHITQDAGVGSNGIGAGVGAGNIAIGKGALNAITTGNEVIAIGTNALAKLTVITGGNNLAIGSGALSEITTQQGNLAIGQGNLKFATSSFNTAVGIGALTSAATGGLNTAFGNVALSSLTTGDTNTAIGYRTASNMVTAYENTFLGGNTAVFLSGGSNQHNYNTFVGSTITTNNNNGPSVGAVYTSTTALGQGALQGLSTTVSSISNSTFLGKGTTLDTSVTGAVNYATAIGASAVVGANNSIVLGRATTAGNTDNVGIGVVAPANALHVKSASNPVRLEGLQVDNSAANVVVVDGTGVLKTVAKTSLVNNIYTADGTLTGNRTVTQGANTLTLSTTATGGTKIISDGTVTTQKAALQIQDGGQALNKVLTSDATGNATWAVPALTVVQGTMGAGVSITRTSNPTNTGSSISLPPGKWKISIQLLLDTSACAANSWAYSKFTLGNTAGSSARTGDFIGAQAIGGVYSSPGASVNKSVGFNSASTTFSYTYGTVNGDLVVNNTTASSKTYYIVYEEMFYNSTFNCTFGAAGSGTTENNITAIRIQ